MDPVSDTMEKQDSLPIRVALCIDRDALDRFGRVLRHLLVGLIDQAVHVRILSSDPRVETLSLGPVQAVLHERMVWPVARRRLDRLLDALSQQPPTIVQPMSSFSYAVADRVAEAFDADLVLQVTSLADCEAVAELKARPVGQFLAPGRSLVRVLVDQLKIPAERVELIRPGVLAEKRIACFADPHHTATILNMSALQRNSGVDQLIEAIDLLRKRGHAMMLFLLGRGHRESAVRRLIRERKLSSIVTLAHPHGDLTQALHNADIFVRPSADTTYTADSLQAMGAGMAVVSGLNTVCDNLRGGETAVICDKLTATSLADAIEGLLTDRAGAQRIAKSGMEYVRTHHSVSGEAQRMADVYRRLALARTTLSITE